jgi:putative redox protein
MPAERFDFTNAKGERLAALLDNPPGEPRAYALFVHCFTCGKDLQGARRIAEGLTALGIGVLRFDFTGLGASEGEFANTTFSSNIDDVVAAADQLRRTRRAPAILIGHSLGGAAVLAAASRVPEARAVVTIAAPYDPGHVTGLFKERLAEIAAQGEVEVTLAGRPFRIRRSFLDDIAEQNLAPRIGSLRRALLIFHSPTDEVVGIENASHIFAAAKHPKSFVSLDGADHFLTRREDAAYVANVIAAWAERYLDMPEIKAVSAPEPGTVVVSETRRGRFQQEVVAGLHRFFVDEPVQVGGLDSGPGPYDSAAGGTRRLHGDDVADLCRAQGAAARGRDGTAASLPSACRRLRIVRDQRRHDRSHRSADHLAGRSRCRPTHAPLGDRRQVPSASDVGRGDRRPHHRAAGRNLIVTKSSW